MQLGVSARDAGMAIRSQAMQAGPGKQRPPGTSGSTEVPLRGVDAKSAAGLSTVPSPPSAFLEGPFAARAQSVFRAKAGKSTVPSR